MLGIFRNKDILKSTVMLQGGCAKKKQHKTTVDKGMETNALSGFALLLATWVGVADFEVRWARS